MKAVAVKSAWVKEHLIKRSNNFDIQEKIVVLNDCTNLKPINVKSFKNREIDILFFEKYVDLNRENEAKKLLALLSNNSLIIQKI